MYMMNLEEDESIDYNEQKMNTTGQEQDHSKGDGHTIEWSYHGNIRYIVCMK